MNFSCGYRKIMKSNEKNNKKKKQHRNTLTWRSLAHLAPTIYGSNKTKENLPNRIPSSKVIIMVISKQHHQPANTYISVSFNYNLREQTTTFE